jgi:hypothetical protein
MRRRYRLAGGRLQSRRGLGLFQSFQAVISLAALHDKYALVFMAPLGGPLGQ